MEDVEDWEEERKGDGGEVIFENEGLGGLWGRRVMGVGIGGEGL